MPSAARYAREKAAAEAAGTTPYRQRVASARRRAPGVALGAARGHAEPGTGLQARRRRREARIAFEAGPTGFCVVCGVQVEPERPRSFADRICGNEQVRRWRDSGEAKEWASFRGLAQLAADAGWVRRRRSAARAAGLPVRRPAGVALD